MNTVEARQRIIDLARELQDPDPRVVAGKLIQEIPENEYGLWLGALLPDFVRETYRSYRGYVPTVSDDQRDTSVQASGKWKRQSDFWSSQVYAIDGGRRYVYLGDLTTADCEYLAGDYQQRADANAAKADKFRLLHAELQRRRKGKVRDLGEETVKEVMS